MSEKETEENTANVVKMKKAEKKVSNAERLGGFVGKNRVALLVLLGVLIVGVIAYSVAYSIYTGSVKKNLDKIEMIEFSLTKDAADLEASVINSRQDTALSNLEPYLTKGGIVGARADMLAADIHMQRRNWVGARALWLDAAAKRSKTYIASICNFNAAACSEELGENERALEYYTKVCEDKDFVDRSRAYFSAGRLKEGLGDYEGAKTMYEAIASLGSNNDIWNDLAKTRLVALKIEGKIQ